MGGGIIGLEMGTVYKRLEVVDVAVREQVMTGTDKDIVKVYTKQMRKILTLCLKQLLKLSSLNRGYLQS